MKNTLYGYFRLSVKILFLLFLTLAVLGKYGYIFTQEYYSREWIWFILGLLTLVVIIGRRDLISYLNGDRYEDAANKKEMLITFGLFAFFGNLWLLFSPRLQANDEVYFLKNNYDRFEEIAKIRTFLFKNNPDIGTLLFTNTGKFFDRETRDTLGNTLAFNKNLSTKSELATNTIRNFTTDLEIHDLYLTKDTISFYFKGNNKHFLSRTNQKNAGGHYVWSNYFIDEVKKKD